MKPEPGIYENIPFNTYLAWEAVSNSKLSLMEQSALHFKKCVAKKPSNAFQLGSLAHCGALESTSLAKRYAVMPPYEMDDDNKTTEGKPSTAKSTTYYKEKEAAFREANAGKTIVVESTYDAMAALVYALQQDPETWSLLSHPGKVELSIVWECPETGILCKARIDKLAGHRMADLKTTKSIAKFQNAILDYGYHRQLAFYQRGWYVLTGELLEPWLCAVEGDLPHAVASAPLGYETLEIGKRKASDLMRKVESCLASGEWPGPKAPEAWELPEWARNKEPITLSVGGVTVEI